MAFVKAPLGAALLFAFAATPCFAVDTKPHIDTSGVNMQPAYPASAYGTGERGAVVMAVAVTAEGKVSRIRLLQTSGFNDIDGAAIAGVMGWKFTPATHDGTSVEGVSTIKLVFQPPDPPPPANAANAPAPQAPPDVPAPTSVFAPEVTLEAGRGKYADLSRPIPCANGRVDVTIAFQRVNGIAALPGERADPAFAALEVLSGGDVASVIATDEEFYAPPIEDFAFERSYSNGADTTWLTYSFFGRFGAPQTVSIYWNSYGLVTGKLGGSQTHETQLPTQPTEIRLRTTGMAAKFLEPELICLPDSKIPGG